MDFDKLENLSLEFEKLAKKDEYWAGFLYFCPDDNTILLIKRSGVMNNPHLWDLPGGRSDKKDDKASDTAIRECSEEIGTFPPKMSFYKKHTITNKKKDLHIFICVVPLYSKNLWLPKINLNRESSSLGWFPIDKLPNTRFDLSWVEEELGPLLTKANYDGNLIKCASIMKPRYEYKYFIPSNVAKLIKEYIAPHVVPDEHGQHYKIKNIYLDNDDYKLYNDHLSKKNRFKLRIRFYENDDDKVSLEIKRKIDGNIIKHRSLINQNDYPNCLNNAKNIQFIDIAKAMRARPVLVIDYDREAYNAKSDKSDGRVTFDTNIRYNKATSYNKEQEGKNFILPNYIELLELKFNGDMPKFMRKLIDKFDLKRSPMSKYIESINDMLYVVKKN